MRQLITIPYSTLVFVETLHDSIHGWQGVRSLPCVLTNTVLSLELNMDTEDVRTLIYTDTSGEQFFVVDYDKNPPNYDSSKLSQWSVFGASGNVKIRSYFVPLTNCEVHTI